MKTQVNFHPCRRLTALFLSLLLLLICMAGLFPARATTLTAGTQEELTAALAAAGDAGSLPTTITLTGDITLTDNLKVEGNVTLQATDEVTIDLGVFAVDVTTGARLTVANGVTLLQPAPASSHPVYVRDNARLCVQGKILSSVATGRIYTINAVGANIEVSIDGGTVSTSSVDGRAVYTNTASNVITIENGSILAPSTAYGLYRGVYVLRGSTTISGKTGGSASVYDFREASVSPSVLPESFQNGQAIVLTKDGDGASAAAGCQIYYTTDGSDPSISRTAVAYSSPFYVPVNTTLKTTLRKDGFSSTVSTFQYGADTDTVPGIIASAEPLAQLSVPLFTPADKLLLPGAVLVQLQDGRSKYVRVSWDTSGYDASAEGDTTLYGTLQLDGLFLSNPLLVRAVQPIRAAVEEIHHFEAQVSSFLKQGKTSVAAGAAVLTLSAQGGDAPAVYTLVDEGTNQNSLFAIKDNVLLASTALSAAEYTVGVEVTAGSKSARKSFTFTVAAPDPLYTIRNPYEGIDWSSIIQVKAALHNHTVNTNAPIGEWNDGVSGTVATRVPVYESLGFGAIAFTDHDYVSYPWKNFGLTGSSMLSIAGNELSKNAHMLSYFSTYFDRKGEGSSMTDGMIQNIINVGAKGGFLYIAHPNRSGGATRDPDYDMTLLNYPQVRGLEVLNAGQFTNNHSEELWDTLLSRTMPYRDIWGTASDDAHSDSLSVVGTGWTYLLLNEKSEAAAKEAMINGQTYFSSWRVVKGEDDSKSNPGTPAPTIAGITVDEAAGTITIDARDADTIEWVSENGVKVADGATIDVNTTPGVAKYVRARMFGAGGQTMTQPFGLLDSTAPDTEKPVITVSADVPTTGDVGKPVTFPTATAQDAQDGEVFAYTVVTGPDGKLTDTMDNQFVPVRGGKYTITYRAKDAWNNTQELSFELQVPDTVKPRLTVEDVPQTGVTGQPVILPVGTAVDDVDGTIAVAIRVTGPNGSEVALNGDSFTPKTAGKYTVLYQAQDGAGNLQTAQYTITVTQAAQDGGPVSTGSESLLSLFSVLICFSAGIILLLLHRKKHA